MIARGSVLAIVASVLIGCDQITNQTAGLGASGDAATGVRAVSMLDGDVRVQGPSGYCIDQSASDAARGFAVMAGCRLLSRDQAAVPALNGLITVQFGDAATASVTGNEDAFADFLKSQASRALLSGNGDVTILARVSTTTDNSAVLAQFDDTSGSMFPGTNSTHWRGFLDVRGRLATVSVLSFDRAPLSAADGERLLIVAMAQLAEINAPSMSQDASR